ncbi:MAG TPA: tripartite tricarboxylate transporter substrate binding protein [Burkholderiales bacterium]|jgi:tripartite-type tricarboxylate transporter receptor subunit TctC|nr:tripartite tricarboxylate transporter substrate binding protein [Burkholderiales bacterium]
MRSALKIPFAACCAIALTTIAAGAQAQSYPTKSIRLIVPFAAGGSTDALARAVGQKLGDNFGQQVIVDNRTGANGNIGTDMVAKANPDGYTLLMAFDATMVINPSAYSKLPFDPIRDFAPITKVAALPLILVAHPSFPASNTKELIAYAKSKPGINYSSSGHASTPHLAMLMFAQRTGTQFTHIAYKGGGQAVIDVLAGQIPLLATAIPTVQAHIKAGKLKGIALTSAKRHASLPDVGTFAEAGITGFDVSAWYGLLAPAGTPRPVVVRIHDEVVKILATPEMKERFLTTIGGDPVGGTPEQFAADIKSDIARWAKIVNDSGIKLE